MLKLIILSIFLLVISSFIIRLIFPSNYGKKLQHDLLPILQALIDFSKSLQNQFILATRYETAQQAAGNKFESQSIASIKEKKQALEKAKHLSYPEWVYVYGFNPGLREGFRFFLLKLEHLIDLYYSLAYYLKIEKEKSHQSFLLLFPFFCDILKKNEILLNYIIDNFQGKNNILLTKETEDFINDVTLMENTWDKISPKHFEQLALGEDIFLAALVRTIKDTRDVLLQLVRALEIN